MLRWVALLLLALLLALGVKLWAGEWGFREISRLSKGAYCRFDPGAAHQLGELLRAAAAYAAGGMRALADLSKRHDAGAIKLIEQMRS